MLTIIYKSGKKKEVEKPLDALKVLADDPGQVFVIREGSKILYENPFEKGSK